MVRSINTISLLAIPFLLAFFPLYAALRGIKVYEEFIEGAKDGFSVAVRIIPYLVAILVGIGMFRGGGGKQFGADSLLVRTAATIYGSTETTFYVVAVYFGSVGVHRTRHAVPAGLVADLAGIVAAVIICRLVFGAG